MPAIRGAIETIQKWKPVLFVEIWKMEVEAVSAYIESLGYRGLFFFENHLRDLTVYDPDIHTADENGWSPLHPERFDASLYVINFYFIPVG